MTLIRFLQYTQTGCQKLCLSKCFHLKNRGEQWTYVFLSMGYFIQNFLWNIIMCTTPKKCFESFFRISLSLSFRKSMVKVLI